MLIKNGRLVRDNGVEDADLRVKGDKITEIDRQMHPYPGEYVIDASNRLVMPGMIDAHTHFHLKSRGVVTADDFSRGGKSAAFGGVTTVIDYADQLPSSLSCGLAKRLEEAAGATVDYSLHLVINNNFDPGRQLGELAALRELGVSSIKVFTTYRNIYLLEDWKLARLFSAAGNEHLLLTVHAEDDRLIRENLDRLGLKNPDLTRVPEIRDDRAEAAAVRKMANLSVRTGGAPVYIVHLSSRAGLEEIRAARRKGVEIYAETAPHYLLLNQKLLQREDAPLFLMTPPLRQEEDNLALWQGVREGLIQVIATDHCAFSREQKYASCSLDTLPGIPGVETLLPLIYTYGVKERGISLVEMVKLLSGNPARLFGLYPRKGTLEPGSDADLVIYEPAGSRILSGEELHSAAGYTPYEGVEVTGRVLITILRGEIVVAGRDYYGLAGQGSFIAAGESSVFSD